MSFQMHLSTFFLSCVLYFSFQVSRKQSQMPCAWSVYSHSNLPVEWFLAFLFLLTSSLHLFHKAFFISLITFICQLLHIILYHNCVSVFEGRICFLAYGWDFITVLWINQWFKTGKSWNFARIVFLFFISQINRKHWLFCWFFKGSDPGMPRTEIEKRKMTNGHQKNVWLYQYLKRPIHWLMVCCTWAMTAF